VQRTREPDCFPEAAGPLGKKRELNDAEDVCIGYRYGSRPEDKWKLVKHLWPGNFDTGYEQFRGKFTREYPRAKPPSKREWVVIMGKAAMTKKALVGSLGSNAACCLRIALGIVGVSGF
jgi:hypothetical protein